MLRRAALGRDDHDVIEHTIPVSLAPYRYTTIGRNHSIIARFTLTGQAPVCEEAQRRHVERAGGVVSLAERAW